MAISTDGLNAVADHLAGLATHVGLVDGSGTELTGGTYARLAVSWTAAADGLIRPTADKDFDVPAGVTVGGWRAFSASTGGTNYGGADVTSETFASAGTYRLVAANTAFDFDAA